MYIFYAFKNCHFENTCIATELKKPGKDEDFLPSLAKVAKFRFQIVSDPGD
jgi:hypothetical protein